LPARAYDVILMNINMPEMDGISAAKAIRTLPGAYGTPPIIALTANAMEGGREQYLEAGKTGYVAQPIKPAALFAEIARVAPVAPDGDLRRA